MVAPPNRGAAKQQQAPEAADGRPAGIGGITYATAALTLLDHGYAPLPLVPGEKRPVLTGWSSLAIDSESVARWVRQFPHHGIGLRTGQLVGIDIDILDPEMAHQVDGLVRERLGETLTRIGYWPKRLLLYRTDVPIAKLQCGQTSVEILGCGQQAVVFGIHPDTRQPYSWIDDTPLDVPLEALPLVDRARLVALGTEIEALLSPVRTRVGSRTRPVESAPIIRNELNRVIDGRDGWLSTIAFHAVHDALERGSPLDRLGLATTVWQRFQASAELTRARKDGPRPYQHGDAEAKVADKLRLLAQQRLPRRTSTSVAPPIEPPTLDAKAAREQLQVLLEQAALRFEAWHETLVAPAPQLGIRATVGLGKSRLARRVLIKLRERLLASGLPSRVLVLTPSHALAEEAAAAWRAEGVSVAVHRGYETKNPASGEPLCRDPAVVRMAIEARIEIQANACANSDDRRCAHFDGCAKQQNRRDVMAADVIIATHDVLFSGLPVNNNSLGVILVDEGCWSRAVEEVGGLIAEGFRMTAAGEELELVGLRRHAAEALIANGPGPLRRASLVAAGLTVDLCARAACLEARHLGRVRLYPGMSAAERRGQQRLIATRRRRQQIIAAWGAMAALLAGDAEQDGRLTLRGRPDGTHEIAVTQLRKVHPDFLDKPVLHLDATLRPESARTILPRLEVEEVAAAMPHMHLTLISGSFGKSMLCPSARAGADESRRRANRLRECVDYVLWQAHRVAPGKLLVVTYKDVENAFRGLPNVAVAHFNAIAGLDAYRDVGAMVVVGRPLPQDTSLHPLSAAFFGHVPELGYQDISRNLRMRDGSVREIRAIAHEDSRGELLRTAICDDEVLQAIGRGRGVNRTAGDPLEVHVLADVALPLVHDQLLDWDTVKPGLFQRMLLAGVAVDSPTDALRLHPALFTGVRQAEAALARGLFPRHSPIDISYREMSGKSAAYRRAGRGRSWQRAWWLDISSEDAKGILEAALGPLAGWRPDE